MLLSLQIEKGLTMLFVTHDIGLARKIGDRVGVMLAGRLVEVGPAASVIGHPGHPYTGMLLDSARELIEPASMAIQPTGAARDVCPFMERCARFGPACQSSPAAPVNLDSGRHLAWCWNPMGDRSARPSLDFQA